MVRIAYALYHILDKISDQKNVLITTQAQYERLAPYIQPIFGPYISPCALRYASHVGRAEGRAARARHAVYITIAHRRRHESPKYMLSPVSINAVHDQ